MFFIIKAQPGFRIDLPIKPHHPDIILEPLPHATSKFQIDFAHLQEMI